VAVVLQFATLSMAQQQITPLELVDKCEQAQQKFITQISKSENTRIAYDSAYGYTPKWYKEISEVRYDGDRYDIIRNRWYDLESADAPTPLSEAQNYRQIWDGNTVFDGWFFAADNMQDIANNRIVMSYDEDAAGHNYPFEFGAPLNGILMGDDRPATTILREAKELTLRPNTELVGNSQCYVLEAVGKQGTHTIWIDPEHGYNIAKARVYKSGANLAFGRTMGLKDPPVLVPGTNKPRPEVTKYSFEVTNVKFEKVGDTWVPMEGDFNMEIEYDGGRRIVKEEKHSKRTYLDINPDFEAVGAFGSDLPNGVRVQMPEAPGVTYRWQDGKLVTDIDTTIIQALDTIAQEKTLDAGAKFAQVLSEKETKLDESTKARKNTQLTKPRGGKTTPGPSPGKPVAHSSGSRIVLRLLVVAAVVVVGWSIFSKFKRNES